MYTPKYSVIVENIMLQHPVFIHLALLLLLGIH